MSEFIGVVSPFLGIPSKRDVLLFDRFGVVMMEGMIAKFSNATETLVLLKDHDLAFDATFYGTDSFPEGAQWISESQSLLTAFIIVRAMNSATGHRTPLSSLVSRARLREFATVGAPPPPGVEIEASVHSALRKLRSILETNPNREQLEYFRAHANEASSVHLARLMAHHLAETFDARATPLLPAGFDGPATIASRQAKVANLVIKALPSPDEGTPWERIFEFRADEDARRALRRLRVWMSSVVASDRTAADIEDEFQALLDRYVEYMRLHEIKTQITALQTFVTVAADIIENVAKLNLGTAARSLFSLREQKLHLTEAEMSAPGREVAYVVAAQKRFAVV